MRSAISPWRQAHEMTQDHHLALLFGQTRKHPAHGQGVIEVRGALDP
ncbi:MAG: hypothetical protein M3065_12310 [Actinomycetota bacterium]|nr:hypothetical protein [Actinomycetota bacterium]